MADTFEDLIDGIGGATEGFKSELKQFLRDTVQSSDDFLRRQARKIILYLSQLSAGEITRDDFRAFIEDVQTLTEIQAAMESAVLKKRLSEFAERVRVLFVTTL